MTNRPLKLILLLTGIFVAGSMTGAFVMMRFGRKLIEQSPRPEQWATIHMNRLADRLELGSTQVEQIQPIVRRNMEEVARLRNQCLSDSRVVFESMHQAVAEKLNPEQKVRFEEFNRELLMRERARKNNQKKPNRPSDDKERPERPERPRPVSPAKQGN